MADIVWKAVTKKARYCWQVLLFGSRLGFCGVKLAARCRFIFVDYFIVVERCNQTVKPEREIRTTINQNKLCSERVRKVKKETNIYIKRAEKVAAGFIFLRKI